MSKSYFVQMFPEMGRGLVAKHSIDVDSIITVCELLVLDAVDTWSVNKTALQFYTFKFNESQDCLVLGDGEIFNHSDKPNVTYRLESYGDRMMMVFQATSRIEQGEQLFIDYSQDMYINAEEYTKAKSLTGSVK